MLFVPDWEALDCSRGHALLLEEHLESPPGNAAALLRRKRVWMEAVRPELPRVDLLLTGSLRIFEVWL